LLVDLTSFASFDYHSTQYTLSHFYPLLTATLNDAVIVKKHTHNLTVSEAKYLATVSSLSAFGGIEDKPSKKDSSVRMYISSLTVQTATSNEKTKRLLMPPNAGQQQQQGGCNGQAGST
jgi:hypothetical protein